MISVIIPIYQVKKYLDQCVTSIVNQSYKDLEIILVDDGSLDNSGIICDRWATKDSRIHVIHQENSGVSAARNAGLDAAHGEYIGFVDPDDWIHRDMYQYLYLAICEKKADIAICHEYALPENEFIADSRQPLVFEREENHIEAVKHFTDNFTGPISWVWNKLYRREFIDTVRFVIGKNMEDIFFSSDVFARVNKVVWIENRLYYYRQLGNSICGHKNDKYYLNFGEGMLYMDKVISANLSIEEQSRIHIYVLNKLALLEAEATIVKMNEAKKQLRVLFLSYYKKYIPQLRGKSGVYRLYIAKYAKILFYGLKYRQIMRNM